MYSQFHANVLGLSFDLFFPVIVDMMLIYVPFSFPLCEIVFVDAILTLDCKALAKLALRISTLSDKMMATCMDLYSMRLFEPINPTLAMKRLSDSSPGPCNRPALSVMAASWVPNKASWGFQREAFEVEIKCSECLYSSGLVCRLGKTDETPWIFRGILRDSSRV